VDDLTVIVDDTGHGPHVTGTDNVLASRSRCASSSRSRLSMPLSELADKVGALPDAQRVEQSGNGRLIKRHRRVLLRCALGRYTSRITPVAHLTVDPIPTTSGDSYVAVAPGTGARMSQSAARVHIRLAW
jgi:hypothetical protein